MPTIPQEVLGDKLGEVRAGRRVRAAVFTTFSFDPGFFELHILPLLFDQVSQIEKVKRIQLEDLLQSTEVAVYYDRTALAQNALPAQTNFRRIDVRRHGKGVFHPKLVLMLVEEPESEGGNGEPILSLIVGVFSANLTRAGWWKNVESGHFEEVRDLSVEESRIPFRKDLLSIMRRVRDLSPDDDHPALDQIHAFLRARTHRGQLQVSRHGGLYFTRLFSGQKSLPEWLAEIGIGRRNWNLEIISPYFDRDHAGTLDALCSVLTPEEVRVFLPTDNGGASTVSRELYDSISGIAFWGQLPDHVVRSGGRPTTDRVPNRRVHAKLYRMWKPDGPGIVLTGSINLTSAGHSHAGAGNLEAAFLVGIPDGGRRSWWLRRLDAEPVEYWGESAGETDEATEVFVDVSLQFDWRVDTLSYRIDGAAADPFNIAALDGQVLARIDHPTPGRWIKCSKEASSRVRSLLASTSLVELTNPHGAWRVLIREDGIAHRPSLIAALTPEEILMYWSLLSPEQREAFIEKKMQAEARQEGLTTSANNRLIAEGTVFDQFSGVYHAFGRLSQHVEGAIARGNDREAEARLFGAKYDSLPVLLGRLLDREASDPAMDYVTFLCAKQVRDRVRRKHRQFWKDYKKVAGQLDEQLARLPAIQDLLLPDDPERERFLEWYRRMFMAEATIPRESV